MRHSSLGPRRLFSLLLSLVALFLLYPLMVELERVRFFRLAFILVLILAVYSVGRSRRQLWTAVLLGCPAILAQAVAYARPEGVAQLMAAVVGFLFLSYVTVVVFRSVISAGPVTRDKIAGAISVYLLLGLLWALLYGFMEMVEPGSFRTPSDTVLEFGEAGKEYTFIYYSFVTLTTLGYGEISPASHWSRTFAWVEAVIGQLFLAILIARLVGLHIYHSMSDNEEAL